jgi:enterochelin esterase family protein
MRILMAASLTALWGQASLGQLPARPAGQTADVTIPGKAYPRGRHAWVYTPAGYPASCQAGCNLIVAFDGAIYVGIMGLPQVLDSLVARRETQPAVAVLIDNGPPPGRINDLANSSRYADWIAGEMIPWIREHYSVARAPDRTLVTGSSAGGLGAAYVALKHPELFGNVLSQSGAFWRGNEASNDPPYEWLTQQYASSPKLNIKFFIDVGARETTGALGGRAPSLLEANRRLQSVLNGKGYWLRYYEVPNGDHSPETWAKRLPFGIVALLPSASPPR